MKIEVRNTHLRNQGAQLMLRAIRERFSEHQVVVSDRCATPATRRELGLSRLVWVQGLGKQASLPEWFLPEGLWSTWGRVPSRSLDMVLDASGFAYGDQWGVSKAEISLAYLRRVRARGQRYVLMPQALGPFEHEPLRSVARQLLSEADLVFPRDVTSLEAVHELIGEQEHVQRCPDCTITLSAHEYEGQLPSRAAAVVPNHMMMVKGDSAPHYVPSLVRVVERLEARGLTPVLVLHSRDDAALAEELRRQCGRELPCIEEFDARRLKGLLGACEWVVASRFHALVSALSCGVPCLATGWSHKYEHLMDDFGCAECLLPLTGDFGQLEEQVDGLLDEGVHGRLQQVLRERKGELAEEVERMWQRVERCAFGPDAS